MIAERALESVTKVIPFQVQARLAPASPLRRLLDALDDAGLEHCIPHGCEELSDPSSDDVDILVAPDDMPRLVALLRRRAADLGVRPVQWLNDGPHTIVLAGTAPEFAPLVLHVRTAVEAQGGVLIDAARALRWCSRHPGGYWVASPRVEFVSLLASRLMKRLMRPSDGARLAELWARDESGCRAEVRRLFSSGSADALASALASQEWDIVQGAVPALRRELLWRAARPNPASFAARWVGRQQRRFAPWLRPRQGLHVVFLGPDGVGKSTVIDAVVDKVAPAFRHVSYGTFARSLVPPTPKATPHELPVRSLGASLLKVGWWAMNYTLGHFVSTARHRADGGLVINHRYLVDAIVDPRRYRYGGPTWLLRWLWAVVAKPDLVVVLDAPANVIQRRKQETTFAETARQRDAYRALAASLPNAWVVNTDRPLEPTVLEVVELILGSQEATLARRIGA